MIRRPKIGMRVRITSGIGRGASHRGSGKSKVVVYDYDASRGDTGTLVEITNYGRRGHGMKWYMVQLDPPNIGILTFGGTSNIEELKAEE